MNSKRNSRKRPYFQSSSTSSKFQDNIVQSTNDRIQLLTSATTAHVRSGQVISSVPRAIEELVHNSVVHGKAQAVDVKIGTIPSNSYGNHGRAGRLAMSFLEVSDDGVGIDPESNRLLIGTDHCSSSSSAVKSNSSSKSIFCKEAKGESLKALAALSIEMQITATIVTNITVTDKENKYTSSFITPKFTRITPRTPSQKHLITSKKIIKNDGSSNSTVQFTKSVDGVDIETTIATDRINSLNTRNDCYKAKSENNSKTGTSIRLYGLFHRHSVRRKHYQEKSDDRVIMAQARACIQLLALTFPTVAIRLINTRSNSIDTSWSRTSYMASSCSRTLKSGRVNTAFDRKDHILFLQSLKERLVQLCPDEIQGMPIETEIEIIYEEKGKHVTSPTPFIPSLCMSNSRCERLWKLNGILLLYKEQSLNTLNPEYRTGIPRQHHFIFVNQRPLRKSTALCDKIESICSSISRLDDAEDAVYSCRFVMHISCPERDTDLILEETRALKTIKDKGRLEKLIENGMKKGFKEGYFQFNVAPVSTPVRTVDKKKSNTSSSPYFGSSSRLVTSGPIISSTADISPCTKKGKIEDRSPFTSAFFSSHDKPVSESPSASFDDIFYPSGNGKANGKLADLKKEPKETEYIPETNNADMAWTRRRLKAFEAQVSSLIIPDKGSTNHRPISLSKEMLAKAKVVGQLDAKFIIVIIGNLLCIVDQHAADERVGLERLENALAVSLGLASCSNADDTSSWVDLTKRAGISKTNLIKSVPMCNSEPINLSSTQVETVHMHKETLKKWNFEFEVERGQILHLLTVPSICDRVATPKDFLQFIQALSNRTTDASLVKPAFIRRVLCSLACRYAIMFGDILSEKDCTNLIHSLAKCNMSFVCAHGRPSIVPLVSIDRKQGS